MGWRVRIRSEMSSRAQRGTSAEERHRRLGSRGGMRARGAEVPRLRLGVTNRLGISLLEAVVSITIVGLTAVSALEAVGSDMRTAEKARRNTEAAALATALLDWMELMTDRELQALPDSVS